MSIYDLEVRELEDIMDYVESFFTPNTEEKEEEQNLGNKG